MGITNPDQIYSQILPQVIRSIENNPQTMYFLGQIAFATNYLSIKGEIEKPQEDIHTVYGLLRHVLNVTPSHPPQDPESLSYSLLSLATEALRAMESLPKDNHDYSFMKGRFSIAMESFSRLNKMRDLTEDEIDEMVSVWNNSYVQEDQISVMEGYLRMMEEAINHE